MILGSDEVEQTLLPDGICKYVEILQHSKLSFPTPQERPRCTAVWQVGVVRLSGKKYRLLWEGDRQSASETIPFLGGGVCVKPPLWWGELRATPSAPGTLYFFV